MAADMMTAGSGFYWDDLNLGLKFQTFSRTIREADLVNFVNMTWLTEELFTSEGSGGSRAIKGRPVPGALVYAFSEGLLTPTFQNTGLAFLNAEIEIIAPTFVNDTIHVECEVIELRPASKGPRGHVRTLNQVINQDGKTVLRYNPLRIMKRR